MLQKLVETVSIDPRLYKERTLDASLREKLHIFMENQHLQEAVTSEVSAWEVPISRYDTENANGRIYPRKLWERVIKEQRHIWEGAPMLADHPPENSDGDPSRICGIWLEARISDDGYVYGTFVPSGSLGRDLQEHLKNGLRAGTSSSGFGELLRDNKTVDPETYMIERLSDWVLTPSQGTYFTYEASTKETKNASEGRLGESKNVTFSTDVRENKETMNTKVTKLEEKKFRKQMELFLEDAEKISDPQDRLREFEEILSYFEGGAAPELKEKVLNKIEEERILIKKQLQEAEKLQQDLGVKDTEDLKERLTNIVEDAETLKEDLENWKGIAKKLQEKLNATQKELNARPTEAYVQHLQKKIKELFVEQEKLEKLNDQEKQRIEESKKKIATIKEKFTLQLKEKDASIKKTQDLNVQILNKLKELKKKYKELLEEKLEVEQSFESYREKVEAKPKLQESPGAAIRKYTNFRETDAIDSYWADLVSRHGEDIKPYERSIRGAKTYREAMNAYMKVLPVLNESVDYNAARIPESVAIPLDERGALLESVGAHIEVPSLEKRLPKGWV